MCCASFFIFLFIIFKFAETFEVWELEEFFIQDVINIYRQLPVAIRDLSNKSVTTDNILLNLYTGKDPDINVTIESTDTIAFPRKSKIVFLIHGWLDDCGSPWWKEMKDAFLKNDPLYNVIEVDWSVYSKQGYFVAAHDVKAIGGILGNFIVSLNRKYWIPLQNFLVVGHSLGGQIAGFIAKKVKQITYRKLSRIIALDVAGPEFYTKPESERLNKHDAHVVEVIHTSVESFGFNESCGTIDIFPNGGLAQPGCLAIFLSNPLDFTNNFACNHGRSRTYFTASLLNATRFLARKCDSWKTYTSKPELCSKEYVSIADLKTTKRGNFYFNTTEPPPYYK